MTNRFVRILLLMAFASACNEPSTVEPVEDIADATRIDIAADVPSLTADVMEVFDWGSVDDTVAVFTECDPGQGCFMDLCDDSSDCLSGWCVEHLGEGRCTTICQEECGEGWVCQEVSWAAPDVLFVCLSRLANLCKPCHASADCDAGATADVCVGYGDAGNFCGGACEDDGDCPSGFECQEAASVEGASSMQCVRVDGECACTGKSTAQNLTTKCAVENTDGRCEGLRGCGEAGLTECDAPTPEMEVCDSVDNDCDGDLDEETCNDDDICTDDACVDGECQFTPNTAPCDDGNQCTVDDKCGDGVCAGVPGSCDCQEDADCDEFEDGDLCTGTLYCNLESFPYQCDVVPDSPVTCPEPEGIDAPCLAAVCNPDTGECSFAPVNDDGACNDANPCTVGEACAAGACTGGEAPNCNDGNACTDDACEAGVGCVHTPNTDPCQDGDACTTGDVCGDGACAGTGLLNCDDDNACTNDSCNPDAGCVFTPNTLPCDDGSVCTDGDVCGGGECLSGDTIDCDDDNPCIDYSCDPQDGCVNTPNTLPCSDNDPCTLVDVCKDGECVPGGTLDCDDSNVCTDDSCINDNGAPKCLHLPNTAPCGEGYLCANGSCKCVPDCEGKVCGPDSCGGFCWEGDLPLCEKQKGVCIGAVKSKQDCVNGAWQPCQKSNYFFQSNSYQETETLCDLLDNDCDGSVNEELGQTTCGLGECEHTVQNCLNGEPQVCDPLEGKNDEICDGQDNDCDGLEDEGLGSTVCGQGPCLHAQDNCVGGQTVACDPFAGAADEILDGIDNDCDGKVDEGFPVKGTILVTEMMANPDCVNDDFGEWVELYNPGDKVWDLEGWILKDADNDKITIEGSLPIQPKSYLVLGRNGDTLTNGNVSVDYVYNGNKFIIANGGDEAILVGPGGVEVDKVDWNSGFPSFLKGQSVALHVNAYDADLNDVGSNWFLSTVAIDGGCGDKGTPGAANE
jgi:hypothetical protein